MITGSAKKGQEDDFFKSIANKQQTVPQSNTSGWSAFGGTSQPNNNNFGVSAGGLPNMGGLNLGGVNLNKMNDDPFAELLDDGNKSHTNSISPMTLGFG